MIKQTTKN